MADLNSFGNRSTLTIGEIAVLTGAVPRDGTNLEQRISNIAPIDLAGPDDLTFLENMKFAGGLASTRAGALLTTAQFENQAPSGLTLLRTKEPYKSFVAVMREFYRGALQPASPYESDGIAPGATVHPTARLAAGVTVDPGVVIGPRAEIGAGTIISANAVIGAQVRIGRDCSIGPNCSIIHSVLGDRVIVHPGCHIGQDGFGYIPTKAGHIKVPQIGRVVIHDDVEIGSGTNIDRGGIRDTTIGTGTKIDSLVQIAHNVVIGKQCIIAGQSGLAGSVTMEDYAVLAGTVGIAPHVTIGKGAVLAARSGVICDIPPGETWGGYPARPRARWLRGQAMLARLSDRNRKPPAKT